MSGSRRRFTSEYKIEAAHRVISRVAGQLGAFEGTRILRMVSLWVRSDVNDGD